MQQNCPALITIFANTAPRSSFDKTIANISKTIRDCCPHGLALSCPYTQDWQVPKPCRRILSPDCAAWRGGGGAPVTLPLSLALSPQGNALTGLPQSVCVCSQIADNPHYREYHPIPLQLPYCLHF
ncbi:hypothetical protein J6590_070894 [Homalodisca vitripennis]|nr:hypothetical protein J6590_070894 [Homalodisca vitripennis]